MSITLTHEVYDPPYKIDAWYNKTFLVMSKGEGVIDTLSQSINDSISNHTNLTINDYVKTIRFFIKRKNGQLLNISSDINNIFLNCVFNNQSETFYCDVVTYNGTPCVRFIPPKKITSRRGQVKCELELLTTTGDTIKIKDIYIDVK